MSRRMRVILIGGVLVFLAAAVTGFWIAIAVRSAEPPKAISAEPTATVPIEPKVEPTPTPVVAEPKPEIKDLATAKPGDVVGLLKPEIKDWPTSQAPKASDPVLLFDAETWTGARRRVTPDGGLTGFAEVILEVKSGTAITLPFEVWAKVVGTDVKISTVSSAGVSTEPESPKLVALSPLTPADRSRKLANILLVVPSGSEVKEGKVGAGQAIVVVPEWDHWFVDTVADTGGVVKLMKFNVSTLVTSADPQFLSEISLKPGTSEFFLWFTNWWTGKTEK